MGKHQRSKGRRGELEVQSRLNDIGGDAVLLYGQAELGGNDGDVTSTYGLFEVKRRAAFPAWMTLRENVRGVYVRRDRGEWMVLMRAVDLEALLLASRAAARLAEERRNIPYEALDAAKAGVPVEGRCMSNLALEEPLVDARPVAAYLKTTPAFILKLALLGRAAR